jgi:hypothetical protein
MDTLKYCGKSLYSNQAIIDGRKKPWLFAFIFFILGAFLTWIPLLSKGYTANNASMMTASSNAEVDKGFKAVFQEEYFKTISFKDNNGKKYLYMEGLSAYSDDSSSAWQNEYNGTNTKALASGSYVDASSTDHVLTNPTNETITYYFDAVTVPTSSQIDPAATSSTSTSTTVTYESNGNTMLLEAYYLPGVDVASDKNGTQLRANFVNSIILNTDSTGAYRNYPHSFAVFTKDEIFISLFALKASKSNTVLASYLGNVNDGLAKDVASDTTFFSLLFGADNSASITDAYQNFATYLHKAAGPYAVYSIWFNIAMLTASVAGSVLVASIILIVVHKRKTSAYRDTNYWECVKESMTLSFSPCVIAMIVGFLNTTYGLIAVIGCVLLRVVWMINRICPPPTQDDKPLYQARS